MTTGYETQTSESQDTSHQDECGVSKRELLDSLEVRIGLIADRHIRRVLRAFFKGDRLEAWLHVQARHRGAHAYERGLAEEAIEVARVVGAAAASMPGVDRDLVTAAALFSGMTAPHDLFKVVGEEYGYDEGCRGATNQIIQVLSDDGSPEAVVVRYAKQMSIDVALRRRRE